MAEVYIYSENCTDFTTMGLCGALLCDTCVHTEEANGMSEISLTHPIDELGKWAKIQPGTIIKCMVPMKRKLPSKVGTSLVRYYYNLSSSATGNDVYIWSKRSGGSKVFKVPMYTGSYKDSEQTVQTEIVVTGGDESTTSSRIAVFVEIVKWNKKKTDFTTKVYQGYMNTAGLGTRQQREYSKDVSDEWRVEEQLFRIYEVQKNDSGITAAARHIFYDLLKNSTTASSSGLVFNTYLESILSNCVTDSGFEISCGMTDTIDISCKNENPVAAMIGSDGLLTTYGGELVRNNYTIGVERTAGLETGMRIEYGRNLVGLTYAESRDNLVNAIKPIGQTKKGEALELVAGTYTTADGLTVTVGSDLCVYARNVMNGSARYFDDCPEYSLPYIEVLDMGSSVKAAGTSAAQLLAARTLLVAEAIAEFELNKAYLPEITCDVDFVTLGDTDECADVHGLEAVHLYDKVYIAHSGLGVNVSAKVNRTTFDCLAERMDSIEVGTVQRDMSRATISMAQMPAAVTSAIDSASGVAEYASAAADEAQEDASTAQTTADSKAKVTTSASAPSSPSSGDYWIDTENGNELKRYNGTTWDSVQDTAIATAQTTATNAASAASTAQTTATNAATAASTAQTTATNAATAASTAQTTATNAATAASTAQTTATNAATAASTAQTTADSKAKVTTASSAPSSPSSGDYWIDTNNGNVVKKYNGSSWETLQDANVSVLVYQAALNDAKSNTSYVSVTDVSSTETYVNAAGGTTGSNLLMNGATNGNPAYGLSFEKYKLLDEVKWGSYYKRYAAKTELSANATTPSNVKLKTTLTIARTSTGGSATGLEVVPVYGFKICEDLVAGHEYKVGFSGKIESSTDSICTSMFIGFCIGDKYKFSHEHGTDNVIGGYTITTTEQTCVQSDTYTMTEADVNDLKTNPYLFLSLPATYNWARITQTVFTIHSVMLIDVTDGETFPTSFTDCKLQTYSNNTTKTKLDNDGFKVSGFNADGSEKSSATINGGASSGSNGVAAGGTKEITIAVADWSSNTYTATITGLKADATVIVSPAPASIETCIGCNVRCTAQAAGSLTFSCDTTPSDAVTLNCLMLGGVATW